MVLSFSNAYNSVRTHESMHLVGCYLLIGFSSMRISSMHESMHLVDCYLLMDWH